MAAYTPFFKPAADKALRKLPDAAQTRIVAAVEDLRDDPRPPACVKLKAEDDLWRIRVGDYRVVYTVQDDELIVLVVRMAQRRDAYCG